MKLITSLLCIIMLTLLLFACGKDNPISVSVTDDITVITEETGTSETLADVVPLTDELTNEKMSELPAVTEEITETTETAAVSEESYFDGLAKDILKNIKDGNYQEVAKYMGATDVEAYRFIQNMTVDSYEILETQGLSEWSKYFKIKFNISKSDNEYFSAGENYWDLAVENSMVYVGVFRPSNKENLDYINFKGEQDKEYRFCYSFSHDLGIFETADDFNAPFKTLSPSEEEYYNTYFAGSQEKQWENDKVHNILHFYGDTSPDRVNPLPEDVINDYMVKTTGITDIDYTLSGSIGKEDISIVCLAHGGSWLFRQPVSKQYDEASKIYTVVINYYADSALLVVAKTIEYKFTANGDGTYKMLSTELLYDSGYRIAGGAT